MQPLRSNPVRSALAVGTIVVVAGGVTACGDYLRPKDSATNAHIAQTQVEHFVEFYNRDGLAIAVELNVCPDDQKKFAGKESIDGAPYQHDSLAVSTPVGVDGDLARGHVTLTTGDEPPVRYAVDLRREDGQGWCVTDVSQ